MSASFLSLFNLASVSNVLTYLLIGLTSLFLLRKYMQGAVCKYKPLLIDKIVIVTGSNSGIGKQTATVLASYGATVILACRDQVRASEAKEEIEKATGSKSVIVMKLDLSDLNSVREFAKNFQARYKTLDILINNAGVAMIEKKTLTKDNLEMTMASNHFGPFLLTNLLLPTISQTKFSRIINVSGKAYRYSRLDFDNLNSEKSYSPLNNYNVSKLFNIYFTRELQQKLIGSTAKTVSLHPGVIYSGLPRNFFNSRFKKFIVKVFYPFVWIFFKSELQGAQTTLHCALCDWIDLQSGKHYSDCAISEVTKIAQNEENSKKLWEISKKLVQL